MGELMSNDVQSHEDVAERVAGEERRASVRHAARSLGSVTARIIGGSQVDLVNFSNRGVLFECDSRLLIGARTSVRITTTDANLIISGRVVRSRVKGLVNGALRYDAALVLDAELGLEPKFLDVPVASDAGSDADVLDALESELGRHLQSVAGRGLPGRIRGIAARGGARGRSPAPQRRTRRAGRRARIPTSLPSRRRSPSSQARRSRRPDSRCPTEHERGRAARVRGRCRDRLRAGRGVRVRRSRRAVLRRRGARLRRRRRGRGRDRGDRAGRPRGARSASSMFDATYMPPAADDAVVAESQFDVTAPTAALDATPPSVLRRASVRELRQSVGRGCRRVRGRRRRDVRGGLRRRSGDRRIPPSPSCGRRDRRVRPTPDGFTPPALPVAAPDDVIDSHAAVSDTEDRVLLQFAATVPHDLAELRRIAADNQW